MKYILSIKFLFLIGTFILLTGCKPKQLSNSEGGYTYNGIYFGSNFSNNYKKGIRAGCTTSKGMYTKSHWLFQNKQDYVDGWFLGRNKCKDLLKINDNGDLIL